MIGSIVNFFAILIGGGIGLLIKGRFKESAQITIMNGLGLCVLYIGISGSLKGNDPLLIIISIAVGAFIGELIDIDLAISKLGVFIERKIQIKGHNNSIAEGFVTTTLLFCVGAMAIVGSFQSGLNHDYSTLYAKSLLDGVSSVIFAASLGIGVLLSAFSVLIYQGTLTLCAGLLASVLTSSATDNITAVGSLLIIGIGLNILGVTKIKVANLLPAIFIPIIYSFFT